MRPAARGPQLAVGNWAQGRRVVCTGVGWIVSEMQVMNVMGFYAYMHVLHVMHVKSMHVHQTTRELDCSICLELTFNLHCSTTFKSCRLSSSSLPPCVLALA